MSQGPRRSTMAGREMGRHQRRPWPVQAHAPTLGRARRGRRRRPLAVRGWHLVIVGDVFDRGPEVTPALWWIRELEAQALAAGGRALPPGQPRGQRARGRFELPNPKYRATADTLGTTYPALLGQGTVLGDWLLVPPRDDRRATACSCTGRAPWHRGGRRHAEQVNADMAPRVGRSKDELKAQGNGSGTCSPRTVRYGPAG